MRINQLDNNNLPQHAIAQDNQPQPAIGGADESNMAPGEWFDLQASQIDFPDFSAYRQQAREQLGATANVSDIENRAFNLFKQSDGFSAFKESLIDSQNSLIQIVAPIGLKSNHTDYAQQKRMQVKQLNTSFQVLLNRLDLTATNGLNGNYQNYRLRALEVAGRQIKTLSQIASKLSNPNLNPVSKPDEALQMLKDCLNDILNEAPMCGPGFTQKAVNEFAALKLKLFPPSTVQEAVAAKRIELVSQVIREFIAKNYPVDRMPGGNEIHHIAAWQDYVAQTENGFSFLGQINDTLGPIIANDLELSSLTPVLLKMLSSQASSLKACTYIAQDCIQAIESDLGEKARDILPNFEEFTDSLRKIQKKYPSVKERHLLEEVGFDQQLRKSESTLALHFLSQLSAEHFCPVEVASEGDQKIYLFDDLIWSQNTAELEENQEIEILDHKEALTQIIDLFYRSNDTTAEVEGKLKNLALVMGKVNSDCAQESLKSLLPEAESSMLFSSQGNPFGSSTSLLGYLLSANRVLGLTYTPALQQLVDSQSQPEVEMELADGKARLVGKSGVYWLESKNSDEKLSTLHLSDSPLGVLTSYFDAENKLDKLVDLLPKLANRVVNGTNQDKEHFLKMMQKITPTNSPINYISDSYVEPNLATEDDYNICLASKLYLTQANCSPKTKEWIKQQLDLHAKTDLGDFKLYSAGGNHWVEKDALPVETFASSSEAVASIVDFSNLRNKQDIDEKFQQLTKIGEFLLAQPDRHIAVETFLNSMAKINGAEHRLPTTAITSCVLKNPSYFLEACALLMHNPSVNIPEEVKSQLTEKGYSLEVLLSDLLQGRIEPDQAEIVIKPLLKEYKAREGLTAAVKLCASANSTYQIFNLLGALVPNANQLNYQVMQDEFVKTLNALKAECNANRNHKGYLAISAKLFSFKPNSRQLPFTHKTDQLVATLISCMDPEALRFAIRNGANPNAMVPGYVRSIRNGLHELKGEKVTALQAAIDLDSPEMVKVLLDTGAWFEEPKIKYNNDEISPLTYVQDILRNAQLTQLIEDKLNPPNNFVNRINGLMNDLLNNNNFIRANFNANVNANLNAHNIINGINLGRFENMNNIR